ncbi:uncharacterized protein RCH25_038041 [Pelodytes ibericus]
MTWQREHAPSPRLNPPASLLQGQESLGLEVNVPSSPQNALVGSSVKLSCTFRTLQTPVNPNYLALIWKFGNQELLKYDNKGLTPSPRATLDEQATKTGDVSLTLHGVTISDEGIYKCFVIYSPDRQEKEIRLRVQARPVITITKRALLNNEKNQLHCSVTDFYPVDIKVTWFMNGQPLQESSMGVLQRNADGTYRVNSSVIITPMDTQDLIECQVEHESLSGPIRDGFRVVYGAAPTVQIFSLLAKGRQDQVFVCQVKGYHPEPVAVKWMLNGKGVQQTTRNPDGTFNKESHYRIPSLPNNQPADVSCEVEHETLLRPVTLTLQTERHDDRNRSCHLGLATLLAVLGTAAAIGCILWYFVFKKKFFQQFVVSPLYSPQWSEDKKVTLYCTASDCQKDVQVTWSVTEINEQKIVSSSDSLSDDEKERLLGSGYIVKTDQSQLNGLYSVITMLNFTPNIEQHKETEISCKLVCDGRIKERKIKWSYKILKPQISDEKPIKLSLGDSGEVHCSISLQNFNPRDIRVTWSSGVGNYQDLNPLKERVTGTSQQTFDVKSESRIPGHRFQEPGFKVRVTWNHESMEEPEWREVSATDLPWRPQMADIITPPHMINGTEAKLQCTISGYFPDALDVKWLRREPGKSDLYPVSASDKYKFPEKEVTREKDQTFSCTASLIVKVSVNTESGAEFICRVGHPSLETLLEKRTGELSVIGIPVVNFTNSEKRLIAEVGGFYPEPITVTLSRTKGGKYENYSDSEITSELTRNCDGTFRLIKKWEDKNKMKSRGHSKSFKVLVTHKTLTSPIEKIIVREKGMAYCTEPNCDFLLCFSPHDGSEAACHMTEVICKSQFRGESSKSDVISRDIPLLSVATAEHPTGIHGDCGTFHWYPWRLRKIRLVSMETTEHSTGHYSVTAETDSNESIPQASSPTEDIKTTDIQETTAETGTFHWYLWRLRNIPLVSMENVEHSTGIHGDCGTFHWYPWRLWNIPLVSMETVEHSTGIHGDCGTFHWYPWRLRNIPLVSMETVEHSTGIHGDCGTFD